MSRPLLLDLFCGAGGAAMGYYRAGFDVIGVDINPQPHYPFEFRQEDALDVHPEILQQFDVIHASPPCQAYSASTRNDIEYPDLVGPTRDLLLSSGIPYVIENVRGAPLIDPIELCGSMFDELLPRLQRHRLFESYVAITAPGPCRHHLTYDVMTVHGHGERGDTGRVGPYWGAAARKEAMGIDWNANRDEVAQAIPPAYTEHIGRQLLEVAS